MKISSLITYQTGKNQTNHNIQFSGKINAPKNTAAALLTAAAISLTGCATKPVFVHTLVASENGISKVNPANNSNLRIKKLIEFLMSTNDMDKKTILGINPTSYNMEKYLSFKVKNPITEGYDYNQLEKIFGLTKNSLTETNGIRLSQIDKAKGKDLGLCCPTGRQKLKIFTKYLPTEIQQWLENTEFERQW